MSIIKRLILALALTAGITSAIAQAPAPVPALPDTERRTTYNISGTTCACNVNFALYGDGTDYQNWIEVWLNGVRVNFNDPTSGWTITSPSGSLANQSRPITDAVLTFANAQTGTVQIVGARRPRRTSQFNENAGVSARAFNQVLTDLVAQNRELWDKTNDVTGRAVLAPPGETLAILPKLASRASMGACFDSGGNLTSCIAASSGTFAAGNGITFTGTNPTTISTNVGTIISAGAGITVAGTNPAVISASVFTADTGSAPGTLGSAPAPAAGTAAQNGILGIAGWRALKPLQHFVVPPAIAALPQGGVPQHPEIAPSYSNGTSGPGSVVMTRTPSDVFAQMLHAQGNAVGSTLGNSYVDPIAGNDANGPTCAQATPCKTLTYCLQNCLTVNIIGIPTGYFDPFGYSPAASKLYHRLTFTGAASIMTSCPQPSSVTWTVTSGAVYQSNLTTPLAAISTASAPQRLMQDGRFDAGGNGLRFQLFPSLAALQAASNANPSTVAGWFFDNATKIEYIAFFGANVESSKFGLLQYCVAGPGAIGTGDSALVMTGTVTLFIDTPYPLNLEGVSIQGTNIAAAFPSILIEGRGLAKIFATKGNGVHGTGGFWYISGVDCEAPQNDCFNFDPSNPSNQHAFIVFHNIRANYAGDIATFGTGIPMINNGFSCHGGADCIYAGVQAGFNWGPNIADTAITADTSYSWLVGVESIQSADGADAGIGFFGTPGDSTAHRTAWLDTSSTLDEVVSLFASETATSVKVFSSSFNVPPTVGNGAVIGTYQRNAP